MAKNTCYFCEHYRPAGEKQGICVFLDDVAGGSYYVTTSRKDCLFSLKVGPRILTPEETKTRDSAAEERRNAKSEFLKKICEEVKSWPEWKRKASYGQS